MLPMVGFIPMRLKGRGHSGHDHCHGGDDFHPAPPDDVARSGQSGWRWPGIGRRTGLRCGVWPGVGHNGV